jgi:hypothetical protein
MKQHPLVRNRFLISTHNHYWVTCLQTNTYPQKRLENNNEQCFLHSPCRDVITKTSSEVKSVARELWGCPQRDNLVSAVESQWATSKHRSCYQETTGKDTADWKDLTCAAVIRKAWRSVMALKLSVVTIHMLKGVNKSSVQSKTPSTVTHTCDNIVTCSSVTWLIIRRMIV